MKDLVNKLINRQDDNLKFTLTVELKANKPIQRRYFCIDPDGVDIELYENVTIHKFKLSQYSSRIMALIENSSGERWWTDFRNLYVDGKPLVQTAIFRGQFE